MPPGPSLLGAALEQAATLLGSPAARAIGAALGTVALVLEPANDPNASGYEAEKNFSNNHPTVPPDPDAFRLAELERAREVSTLTPDEEAEYIALLAKVKGIHVQNVKELEIDILPENKIDRTLLNPPKKPGNAPTFKDDGTSVEIHHEGQQREGPFREMHWEDHRGKGNDKINHPNKGQPSQVDREEFDLAKKKYWKKEFPKSSKR